jgi:two-component system sensor histidine kinase DesK
MDADEELAEPPRLPWAFAAVFLGSALPAVAGIAAYWAGPAAAAVAVAAFVPPFLYTVPRGRSLWASHRNSLLVTQALLTYVPFAVFRADWVAGLPGLLGGLLLLTVAAPVSWLLFGAALVAEGVLRIAVVGLPHIGAMTETTLVFAVPVYVGVALFGLVRLAGLAGELHATRTELAALTVARVRLRAAERLRAAIGDRIETVATRARAALAVLARAPDEARTQLTEAAGTARQALDQVRVMVADDRREQWRDPTAGPRRGGESTVAPRLARIVLALVLVTLSAQFVVEAVAGGTDVGVAAASVAAIVALAALQFYHSTAWRERARPRGWPWTLSAQLLLTALGFFPVLHAAIHTLGGFVAASALLLLPGHWGWAAFVGIQAAIAAHVVVLPELGTAASAYALLMMVTTGLVVYGLSRLTGLAVELDEARRELARMAVLRERLRVAQDTHDLLGLGLSAIALKSDLIGRLIGRDDARARKELDALVRLSAQARADVLAVTADERRLSLRSELDAAADVLASADVEAAVRSELSGPPLPEQVDLALAAVLREAVTNVLRHSSARRCEIELTVDEGAACLRVTNDGVPDGVAGEHQDQAQQQTVGRELEGRRGGRGLVNLSARAAALGGRLSTRAEGGRFELTVRVGLPAASVRPGGEHALAAGDPAHGVDEVVGGTVLDQEP